MSDYKSVRPTPGRIVIKLAVTEGMTKGGLYLPSGQQEITSIGEVVQVHLTAHTPEGPVYPQFAVGDVVVFGKYSGTELTLDRDKFVIMKESDILATLHKE